MILFPGKWLDIQNVFIFAFSNQRLKTQFDALETSFNDIMPHIYETQSNEIEYYIIKLILTQYVFIYMFFWEIY